MASPGPSTKNFLNLVVYDTDLLGHRKHPYIKSFCGWGGNLTRSDSASVQENSPWRKQRGKDRESEEHIFFLCDLCPISAVKSLSSFFACADVTYGTHNGISKR